MKKKGFTVIEGVISLAILSAIVLASTYFLSQMKVKALTWDDKNVAISHQTAILTRLATAESYEQLVQMSLEQQGVLVQLVYDKDGKLLNHVARVKDSNLDVDFLVYFDKGFVLEGH